MTKVRPVGPGSIVDIVAPAGPFDQAAFDRGLAILRAAGLVPRHRPDIFARDRFLAGDDARRGDELRAAVEAPDSDLLWCARGGYGVTRLLEGLSLDRIRDAGKRLVGFSDITALHARWLSAGLPSIHGPMIARLSLEPEAVVQRLLRLVLEGRAAPLAGRSWVPGIAAGPLAGGNLALLASLCGTPFQPRFEGCIVFLEDIGERPYRLDRALVQCRQAGLFRGIVGLALGEFSGCEEADGSSTSEGVLREHATALGVPVLAGLPCGHGAINEALAFGVAARLDAEQGRLECASEARKIGILRA